MIFFIMPIIIINVFRLCVRFFRRAFLKLLRKVGKFIGKVIGTMIIHRISQHKEQLIRRLTDSGMKKNAVLELVWILKSLLIDNPHMTNAQINSRLSQLGWKNFQLDDQTIELAIACFESEGIQDSPLFAENETHRNKKHPHIVV